MVGTTQVAVLARLTNKLLRLCGLFGLVLLVGYFAYRYVLPHWIAVLFYGYVAGGVLTIVSAFSGFAKIRENATRNDFILGAIAQAKGTDLATRVRRPVVLTADLVFLATVWPMVFLQLAVTALQMLSKTQAVKFDQKEFSLTLAQQLMPLYASLFSIAVAVVLFALGHNHGGLGTYGTLTFWILLVGVMSKHVEYAVIVPSVAAVLRRINGNPYALFVIIVLADFTTLVLTLAITGGTKSAADLRLGDLIDTGTQLLRFQQLYNLFTGTRLSPHQVLVGVAGLLFYLALLGTLKNFREFKRTDEDYVWLANVDNGLGRFSAALRHLREVTNPTAESRGAKLAALVATNELDKAEKEARALLESKDKELSAEAVFLEMWTMVLVVKVPDQTQIALLARGKEMGVRDALLQDLVSLLSNGTLIRTANGVWSSEKDTYPLTVTKLRILADDPDSALEILNAHEPQLPLDDVIRRFYLLTFTLGATRDAAARRDAYQSGLQTLLPHIRSLVAVPNKAIWEVVVLLNIIALTSSIARSVAPDSADELALLSAELKRGVGDEDAWRINAAELANSRLLPDVGLEFGDPAKAVTAYDATVARFKGATDPVLQGRVAEALYNKGVTLVELKRTQDAIAAYDDVVARFGKATDPALRKVVADALVNKGVALADDGKPDAELAVYDDLIARFKDATETELREPVFTALAFKSMTLHQLGRWSAALAVYDELLGRGEDATKPKLRTYLAMAFYGKAAALAEVGRIEDAVAAYDVVVARFKDDADARVGEIVADALSDKEKLLSRSSVSQAEELHDGAEAAGLVALREQQPKERGDR